MKKIINNWYQLNKNKEYFKSFFSISQQKKNASQCFIKISNWLKIIFIAYNNEVKKNMVFFFFENIFVPFFFFFS
jgi:hypothetical protein